MDFPSFDGQAYDGGRDLKGEQGLSILTSATPRSRGLVVDTRTSVSLIAEIKWSILNGQIDVQFRAASVVLISAQ